MKKNIFITFIFLFGSVDVYADQNPASIKESTNKVIVIDQKTKDISNILNSLSDNTTVKIKNGTYTASGIKIEKNNIKIIGESIDNVKIIVSTDEDGVFFRAGKRGPATDYSDDNLPRYNGTLNYWDEKQFSPATKSYPRYKNIRVDDLTIILSDKNGSGAGTGFDFYRVDGGGFKIKVKWDSPFKFGNAVRVNYSKNLDIPYLKIDDNKNSTYSMLYYWSYGLNGGNWDIGQANVLSIDFKHSIKGFVNSLTANGTGNVGYHAVNIGYGTIDQSFNKIITNNGSVNIKSSVEFDLTKNISIKNLNINNPKNAGLTISRVQGLNIGNYSIRANGPIIISAMPFYVASDKSPGAKLKRSSSEFKFDGGYSSTAVENGQKKYFEKRPLPLLKDAKFGEGDLIVTQGANYAVLSNVAGGLVDALNQDGSVNKFNNTDIIRRGYKEQYRTTYQFKDSLPYSLENIDFGQMNIKKEGNEDLKAFIYFTTPIIDSKGNITLYGKGKEEQLKAKWVYNSNFNVKKSE